TAIRACALICLAATARSPCGAMAPGLSRTMTKPVLSGGGSAGRVMGRGGPASRHSGVRQDGWESSVIGVSAPRQADGPSTIFSCPSFAFSIRNALQRWPSCHLDIPGVILRRSAQRDHAAATAQHAVALQPGERTRDVGAAAADLV